MSLLDAVQQRLGPTEIARISQDVGIDEGTTRQAVQSAVPSMIAGMTGHAQTPAGADSMQGLMGSLGNLAGGGAGGGLLGKILGQHQDAVHNEVQASTGLGAEKTGSLLSALAPIVLSALSERGGQAAPSGAGAGSGGIGAVLMKEAQAMQQGGSGAGGGLLGRVLGQFG